MYLTPLDSPETIARAIAAKQKWEEQWELEAKPMLPGIPSFRMFPVKTDIDESLPPLLKANKRLQVRTFEQLKGIEDFIVSTYETFEARTEGDGDYDADYIATAQLLEVSYLKLKEKFEQLKKLQAQYHTAKASLG